MKVKKIVLFGLAAVLACQPADAQFLKKLFKKKAKTERKASSAKADGIDDDAQTALADYTTLADNTNNRNAFLGIPVGIKADRFERLLLEQGFTPRKADGPQTAKSYIYEGVVYGSQAIVTLATSDLTNRVYGVDVADVAVYPSEQAVKSRFQQLKQQLIDVYGRGFVDNQGEAYTIQTPLGTTNLHYERGSLTTSYSLGFTVDDAKAYRMAYDEMDDREYETAPRKIEQGLAPACNHTDLVGLAVSLSQNRTVTRAQTILRSYDYTVSKPTAKALTATFVMDSYRASASLARRKQTVTTVTLTATDDADAVRRDLQTYGFTTTDRQTYRQGKLVVTLSADRQGRVVLTLR